MSSIRKALIIGGAIATLFACSRPTERQRATENSMRCVEAAAQIYRSRTASWPESQEVLSRPTGKEFLLEGVVLDTWGRRIEVVTIDGGLEIRSAGPDGQLHTEDDLFRKVAQPAR